MRVGSPLMIDSLVRAIKGILPDETWNFIFDQFEDHSMRFTKPSYDAVRVSKDYILVRVPKETPTTKT